jgi:hypothetical protein
LTFGTSIADAAYLLYRTSAGVWTSAGVVDGAIKDIKRAPDGKVYVTGEFANIGGVAAAKIAYWDGTWHAMGSGLNGNGYCLAIAPDGYPYVGGNFTTANGVTVNYIAKWTGSTFSAMGTTGTNGIVQNIIIDDSGYLYAGGYFTLAGGVANTIHVAKWTGAAWVAMATGISGSTGDTLINGLSYRGSSVIYAAANMLTDTASSDVYKWTGSAWVALDSGIDQPGGIGFGQDGILYAGGMDSTGTYAQLSTYSGGSWKTILSGSDIGNIMGIDGAANLYFSGYLTSINGVDMPAGIVQYLNKTFVIFDINITTTGAGFNIEAVHELISGEIWIGGNWSTTPITSPAVNASTNGSSKAYPVIRFTGPGKLYQLKNYTTGKAIWFNNLTLQAGETAILDLRPGMVKFTSDWRGNILKYLPGSDFDFFLIPGSNNISLYMTGTSAATKAYMSYKNRYWSIDAAAR